MKFKLGDTMTAEVIKKPKFLIQSTWDWEHIRDGKIIDTWTNGNVCTDEGINFLLDVMFHGTTAVGTWYVTIFESDTTPTTGTTYATPVYTESTAYTEATRPAYVEAAASGKSITNAASKAVFTMNATKTIYGAALVSNSTKGNTDGAGAKLFCAAKFSESKSVVSGDILQVTVTITGADT